MIRIVRAVLIRDLRLAFRRPMDLLLPLVFLLLVATLFPLGLDPRPELLRQTAPATVWMAVLLAMLLPLDRLFREDAADGSLEQWLTAEHSLALLAGLRLFSHWLTTALPLILFTPLAAVMLNLPTAALPALLISLTLATPAITALGGIGAALNLGAGRGGMLLFLLVFPLFVPILIFAAGAVSLAASGQSPVGQYAMLGAITVLSLTLAPFAIARSLRITAD